MRLPIKPLLRLHRKLFTLRTPRLPSSHACTLSFTGDSKAPTVRLRVERRRDDLLGTLLIAAAMVWTLSALLTRGRDR